MIDFNIWYTNFVKLYGDRVFTRDFLKAVHTAMCSAESYYPEMGYCYERACKIRSLLNVGSVATFSINGVSANSVNHKETMTISIPYTTWYRDQSNWVYHSVFEHNNFIFTYELDCPVVIDKYRDALDKLTCKWYIDNFGKPPVPVNITRNEHIVKMRYEKQKTR